MVNKKLRTKKTNILMSYKLSAMLFLMILAVSASLLILMTHTDNQNQNIAQYTQTLSQLNIQNQTLQEKIAEAQSLNNIYTKAQDMGMVQADNVLYVNNTNVMSYNISN